MKTIPWLVLALTLSTSVLAQETTNAPAAAPAPSKTSELLSKATLDKIAAMTPIFDGKTLNGWIQSPISYNVAGGDISNINSFAKKLSEKSDAVSAFLNEQLDEAAKSALAELNSASTNTKAATSALVKGINKIIAGPSIYEQKRFVGVHLSDGTDELVKKDSGAQAAHLNRLLMEDAYPEIAKSKTTAWVVKDGALASTGAGRGVIYTKDDYTNYRIIFDMRQISGNPGHQPCVLFFCTRPAAGEKGLDALGGIQFQVPNGGHWDYRPGFNKGGEGFTNPTKTKFNNREWSQVEILVNAKNGTARMAVAQPVGTKGIVNLVYTNAEAGKTGPFALQMHNGGLFDEYRNVRVELDPKEDKLITAE
jgi:hypothetical protein